MTRRRPRGPRSRVAALVAAPLTVLALVLALLLAGQPALPAVAAEPAPTPADPAEAALEALRDDAVGPLDVARDDAGDVAALGSADGSAVLRTEADVPAAAARELIAEHGAALGVDGDESRAEVVQTLPSATGGAVVRAEQRVDGLRVFGGQVVTVVDDRADVVSVEVATTRDDVVVAPPRVGRGEALRTAVRATAAARGVDPADLVAESAGRVLYDPALVGTTDPFGARPAWEVEVRDVGVVRETVLVGTERGEVALRLDAAPAATAPDRWVCDNRDRRLTSATAEVAVCDAPARTEGQAAVGQGDVDAAYDHVGAALQTYGELGVDLMGLLATPVPGGGAGRVVATVRWCTTSSCPYRNAFWDGRQVVLGTGLARADDVVAHELTHGYVERTANLFYFQQSGALNESFADVLGEVVDQRRGTDDDSAWTVGEDVQGPVRDSLLRSLADPTAQDMPDRMTSDLWLDEHGFLGEDHGGVHHNLGVGNKTAYLISQGGEFNGQSVSGIDAGDPLLRKTAQLYVEVIPTLTSGAEYADLARALDATCLRLAAASTSGFVAADCVSVRQAAAATELDSAPSVGEHLGAVSPSCPTSMTQQVRARSDDAAQVADTTPGVPVLGFTTTTPGLAGILTQYAMSGRESLYLVNPDPEGLGDPPVVELTSSSMTIPRAQGGTFLHFHHAYSFDQEDAATYNDGGGVTVQRRTPSGWEDVAPLAWSNGPTREVIGAGSSPFNGFGGDSRGWGSSRIDLSALEGDTVRVQFRVEADEAYGGYGWWLDDIRLYSCEGPPPGAVTSFSAAPSGTSVTLSWQPPSSGVAPASYVVVRDGTEVATLGPAARGHVLSGYAAGARTVVGVRVRGVDGQLGTVASTTVQLPAPPPPPPPTPTVTPRPTPTPTAAPTVVKRATSATARTSTTRARPGRAFVVRGTVRLRGTTTAVRGVRMTLQRRVGGTSRWVNVSTRTTGSTGVQRWKVSQRRSTAWRVKVAAGPTTTASTSAQRGVRLVR